jgi:myo-inositol-1(or 4)-monophosphatase
VRDALETARAAASEAGKLVRDRAENVGVVRSKSSATDFVSQSDIDAGVMAVRTILAAEPKASFVVEESEVYGICGVPQGSLDADRVWVIDPIDGTTSFLHGYPCYSVSVALLEGGQPVAGAVYNAAMDEMNSAATGLGAFRDGTRLAVSEAKDVPEALLVTGFPYDRAAPLDRQLAVLGAFLRSPVHGIRRDGSAAVDLCHIAGGRCDGYWEYTLKPWDMAAGVVICREAGAVVTDAEGQPWTTSTTSLCVANPTLHPRMLAIIASAFGEG